MSGEDPSIPPGWVMHASPSQDIVLYINKNAKKAPNPPPYAQILPLVSRRPVARGPPSRFDSISPTPTPSGSLSPTSSSISSPHGRDYAVGSVLEEIRCSHVLIKHNESRRPVSWRNDQIRRSKDEAYVIIRGNQIVATWTLLEKIIDLRDQIMTKKTKFEDIAKIFSDCSSARRYGDLGRFKRGQMQKAFELVAFKLKVGQLSQPVETRSGIHIILRTS